MVTWLPWQPQCYVNNSFVLSPIEVIFYVYIYIHFMFNHNTKVKALATMPFKRSDIAVLASNDEPVLNPAEEGVFHVGQKHSDRRLKKGLSRPSKMYKFATLNCRSLKSVSSQAELNKLMHVYNIPIVCIQEHRYVHSDTEPDIVARSIGHLLSSLPLLYEMKKRPLFVELPSLSIRNYSHFLSQSKSWMNELLRQPSKETQRQLLYHATRHTTTCLKKTLSTSTINSVMQLKMSLHTQCSSSEVT